MRSRPAKVTPCGSKHATTPSERRSGSAHRGQDTQRTSRVSCSPELMATQCHDPLQRQKSFPPERNAPLGMIGSLRYELAVRASRDRLRCHDRIGLEPDQGISWRALIGTIERTTSGKIARPQRQLSTFRMARRHADHRGSAPSYWAGGLGAERQLVAPTPSPRPQRFRAQGPRRATPRCASLPAGMGGLVP
jgi:hypothetical protein